MQQSFDDVLRKKEAFTNLLDNDREYDFDLVYYVKKNIRLAEDEIEVVRESLPEDAENFAEFNNKRFELASKYGGEVKTLPNGQKTVLEPDKEEYREEFKKLEEEYSEVIKEQEAINEKRNKIIENKKVDIDWFPLKKEYYPEKIKPSELPVELLDIIE